MQNRNVVCMHYPRPRRQLEDRISWHQNSGFTAVETQRTLKDLTCDSQAPIVSLSLKENFNIRVTNFKINQRCTDRNCNNKQLIDEFHQNMW